MVCLQMFLQHFFSLSPVTTIRFRRPLHCCSHCIPMLYKSSFESFRSYVHLIRTVHSALCFLAHSYNHAIMLALNHTISHHLAHNFFISIGINTILRIVSKRSKSVRQSSSSNCFLVDASCRGSLQHELLSIESPS